MGKRKKLNKAKKIWIKENYINPELVTYQRVIFDFEEEEETDKKD